MKSTSADESHRDATARNERIESRNLAATAFAIGATAAVATGAVLLLWPRRQANDGVEIAAGPLPGGGEIGARWRF